ncbi:MAG: Arc family DNA-binding protein [Thiothrix sp.]|uniref:Arc family DNA-binding protein n=1 Tax=Thiothrix sp. TaxID=1032 RepID=UPI00260EC11C|nr:Arc family DNA-binding protein [Thiothrix sp.]MDD5393143.1 Arc family DNA-binding protein [Thiothrix sp.]
MNTKKHFASIHFDSHNQRMNKDEQQLPATYSIRLPASMRRRLEEFARAGGRSLHAEILLRLGVSLETSKEENSNANIPMEDRVLQLEKAMEAMREELIAKIISSAELLPLDAVRGATQMLLASAAKENPKISVKTVSDELDKRRQ